VVLVNIDGLRNRSIGEEFLHDVVRRIREIDLIGWFDPKSIGLILPYTSSAGARKLVDDIQPMMAPSPPTFRIYTYPSLWLPGGCDAGEANSAKEPVCEEPVQQLFGSYASFWKRLLDLAG
jgi:hypothetical protein